MNEARHSIPLAVASAIGGVMLALFGWGLYVLVEMDRSHKEDIKAIWEYAEKESDTSRQRLRSLEQSDASHSAAIALIHDRLDRGVEEIVKLRDRETARAEERCRAE